MKNFIFTVLLFLIFCSSIFAQADSSLRIDLQPKARTLNEIIVRENYENTRNRKEALSIEMLKGDYILENKNNIFIKI